MATIFFASSGSGLEPFVEEPYDQEHFLQELLADSPEVLVGRSTVDEAIPLLLIRREMPVPTTATTLSLDHLFVDDEAVPVLVEVKRSQDTRARREVVAQMLDYAANGWKYWPSGTIRARLEERLGLEGASDPSEAAAQAVIDLVAATDDSTAGPDVDAFWVRVEDNLRNRRLRLLFVADSLPNELATIIEYLNEEFATTEVLGVEVRQYRGSQGRAVFVPTTIGATTRAQGQRPAERPSRRWDLESFDEQAEVRHNAELASKVKRVLHFGVEHGAEYHFGTGRSPGCTMWWPIPGLSAEARPVLYVTLGTVNPFLQLEFTKFRDSPSYESLLEHLRAIAPFQSEIAAKEHQTGRPTLAVFVSSLTDAQLGKFLDALADAIEPLSATRPPAAAEP